MKYALTTKTLLSFLSFDLYSIYIPFLAVFIEENTCSVNREPLYHCHGVLWLTSSMNTSWSYSVMFDYSVYLIWNSGQMIQIG